MTLPEINEWLQAIHERFRGTKAFSYLSAAELDVILAAISELNAQAKQFAALRAACEAIVAPCDENMLAGIAKIANATELARAALALDIEKLKKEVI